MLIKDISILRARALYYDFFASLFLYELLDSRLSSLQKQIEIFAQSPLNETDVETLNTLKNSLTPQNLEALKLEYAQTFNIPFQTDVSKLECLETFQAKRRKNRHSSRDMQILLYLSYYIEHCVNGMSLLKVRQIISETNLRLNRESFKESEEHLGFLLLAMKELLTSENEEYMKTSVKLFNECIAPMTSRIAATLKARQNLRFYNVVGALLESFTQLEEFVNN